MNPTFLKRKRHIAIPTLLLGLWLALHARAEEPPAAVTVDTGWGALVCEARLGQDNRVFVVDTGATHTLLDRQEFHGSSILGAPMGTGTANDGYQNVTNLPFFNPPPLSIGSMVLQPYSVGLMDLSFCRKFTGAPVCGILGLDAFRNLVVEFDFTAEKIFLHKTTATLPLFEKDRYIRQKSTRGMYALDATLGTEHVSLNIDTGFTGGLHLKQDVFDRLSTKGIIAPAKPTFSTHAFGTTQLRSGVFVSGELCGVPLQGVSVEPHETEGSVGLGFLRRLHLAFDFPSSRLYYSRVPNYAGVLDLQSMLGAKFSFENGQAYIAGLAKQGVIPQLGVKGWENLTQFGETAGPITLRSIYRTCEAMAGKEVPIKIERERRVIYSGTVRLGEKQYE